MDQISEIITNFNILSIPNYLLYESYIKNIGLIDV
jgi:hypothetical protein